MRRQLVALAGGFVLLAGAAWWTTAGSPARPLEARPGGGVAGPTAAPSRMDVGAMPPFPAAQMDAAARIDSTPRPESPPVPRSAPPTASPDRSTTFADVSPDDLADLDALRARRRASFATRAEADAAALHAVSDLPAPDPDLLAAARAAAAAAREAEAPLVP